MMLSRTADHLFWMSRYTAKPDAEGFHQNPPPLWGLCRRPPCRPPVWCPDTRQPDAGGFHQNPQRSGSPRRTL
ncbi:MAG: alpha-E domain-containing protein [Simplicispira sp.]|nr:alpha-E domain-containing protein [Simplicispira sp.]